MKTLKYILSSLLMLALLSGMLGGALAASAEAGIYRHWDSETGTLTFNNESKGGTRIISLDRDSVLGIEASKYEVKKIVFSCDVPVSEGFGLFQDFWMLVSIEGLDRLDTSKVTSMYAMFSGCSALTSLDLSGFDTSNVVDFAWMFDKCSGLTALDLSGFDTSNGTLFGLMFSDCIRLRELDLSGFDTSNALVMAGMFFDCERLERLTVGENFGLSCEEGAAADFPVLMVEESSGEEMDMNSEIPRDVDEVRTYVAAAPAAIVFVSYDANGGKGAMEETILRDGKKLTLPECGFFAPKGKIFASWDLGAPGEKVEVSADTTVKAIWKDASDCTISFDSNGGSGEMAKFIIRAGEELALPECGFTAPKGKVFDCWSLGAPGEKVEITEDTVIQAIWKGPTFFTIHFDPNGGGGEMPDAIVKEGEKLSLPACTFTAPEGKLFARWNLGAYRQSVEIAGDTTVKALWVDDPGYVVFGSPELESMMGNFYRYRILRFDPNGGSGEMEEMVVAAGEKLTLPECGFTAPEGKEFASWELGAPGDRVELSGDTTVKAIWKDTGGFNAKNFALRAAQLLCLAAAAAAFITYGKTHHGADTGTNT